MAALVAALWAYDGWNDLNMVAGEIRKPERDIPIALIAGVAIVGVLYVLVNAAVQYVLPASAVGATQRPASDAMALVLGPIGAGIVSAGMALSMFVALNGAIMSGARVPFTMSRDGYFFSALGQVHPRFHTPSAALLVQANLGIILLLLGGSFRQFFSLAIFSEWLFYMLTASTIFVFRRRDPDAPRPYRVWGYPVVPLLFVLASGVLLYYTFADNVRNSALGLPGNFGRSTCFLRFCPAPHCLTSANFLLFFSFLGDLRFRKFLSYQSTRTADTFTPCPISRNLKLPPGPSPQVRVPSLELMYGYAYQL